MCANFAMHLKNVRSSSSPHPAPTSLLRRDGRLRRTIGRIGTGAEIVGPNDEPVGWSFRWSISDFSTLRIHADTVVSHTSRRHFPPRRTTSSVPVNIVTAECPLECPSYGFEQILLFSRVPVTRDYTNIERRTWCRARYVWIVRDAIGGDPDGNYLSIIYARVCECAPRVCCQTTRRRKKSTWIDRVDPTKTSSANRKAIRPVGSETETDRNSRFDNR